MSVILGIFTKLGAIAALMFLITALLGKLLVATGLLLAALKITVIVIFVGLIVMILLAIFVDRSRRRRDAREF